MKKLIPFTLQQRKEIDAITENIENLLNAYGDEVYSKINAERKRKSPQINNTSQQRSVEPRNRTEERLVESIQQNSTEENTYAINEDDNEVDNEYATEEEATEMAQDNGLTKEEFEEEAKKSGLSDKVKLAKSLGIEIERDYKKEYENYLKKNVFPELEKKLSDILSEYHIETIEQDLKEVFGDDVLGAFDALNKIVYLSNGGDRNAMTGIEEFSHAFVKLMGSIYHRKENRDRFPETKLYSELRDLVEKTSLYKHVLEEYSKNPQYQLKDGKPNLALIKEEALGKALAVAILDKYSTENNTDKTFLDKLKEWLRKVLLKFKAIFSSGAKLDVELNKIADDILNGKFYDNYLKQFADSVSKGKELILQDYTDTIRKSVEEDGGKSLQIMRDVCELGGYITGSLAYRKQTPVYRTKTDALHDIDVTIPLDSHHFHELHPSFENINKFKKENRWTQEQLIEKIQQVPYMVNFMRKYPDARIIAAYPGNVSQLVLNVIICDNEELRDRFISMTGNYSQRLSQLTENEQKQIYLVDLFFMKDNNDVLDYITDEENGLKLTNYKVSFKEKLKYGRAKDLFDYMMLNPLNRNRIVEKPTEGTLYQINQKNNPDIRYRKNVDLSQGREFYTNELTALVPYANKKYHSLKDREQFKADMDRISAEFEVEFTHTDEKELWEKHRWSCNDRRFIDFVNKYTVNGKFTGTKAMWDEFKKIYDAEQTIDNLYTKSGYNLTKEQRANFYISYAEINNIEVTDEDLEMFQDVKKVENGSENVIAAQKCFEHWFGLYPSVQDILDLENTETVDDFKKSTVSVAMSNAFIEMLSRNLGIDYEIIDEAQAQAILSSHGVTYNPAVQISFYCDGKVYFLKDKINSTIVLHEFSHPLINAIRNGNRALFDNLFNKLTQTREWSRIKDMLEKDYPELKQDDDLYKEEALVYAMEYAHNNKSTDGFFKKCIDNIIYAIKQLLRKGLGQGIQISDLSVDTTIGDLCAMLESNVKFEINDITDKDILQFKKKELELADEIIDYLRAEQSLLNNDINTFNNAVYTYTIALREYENKLKKDKNLEKLRDFHTNLIGTGKLEKIVGEASIANGEKEYRNLEDIEILQQRAIYFAKSIGQITYITSKIKEDVQSMSYKNLSINETKALYSYLNLIVHWEKFFEDFEKQLGDAALEVDVKPTLLNGIIAQAKTEIAAARSKIESIFLDMAEDTIYKQLQPMYEKLEEKFQERLKVFDEKGASQKIRDREFIRYHGMTEENFKEYTKLLEKVTNKERLSPEEQAKFNSLEMLASKGLIKSKTEIREMLKGNMGDAKYLNSKMEGYMYSTDPIIGGMASYYSDMLDRYKNKTINQFNDFHMRVQPLMEKVGYNKMKIGSLGKELGFRDKIWKEDKDGNGKIVEVWTFLNEFKDYQADHDMLRRDLDKKEKRYYETFTTDNYNAYVEAKKKYEDFCYLYMNQKYVHEYYETRKIFETGYGIDAKVMLDSLHEEIESLELELETLDEFEDGSYEARKDILDEIDQKRLELKQLASKTDLNGKLKDERGIKIAEIISKYNREMQKFHRTEVDYESFDADFLAFRQSLIDHGIRENSERYNKEMEMWLRKNVKYGTTPEFDDLRQEILNKIIELSAGSENTEKWQQIFAIVNGTRDNMGHINPSMLTNEQIQKIKDIQESMEKEDVDEELKSLLDEYNNLVEKIPTSYYMDSLRNAMADCGMTMDDLHSFGCANVDEFAEYLCSPGCDTSAFEDFASQSEPGETFADWFWANHFEKVGKNYSTYPRYYFNTASKPRDPQYEAQYKVINPDTGNIVATIQGIPAGRYVKRIVKDEYRTERIVGKTVDNKGRWLPKSREQMSRVAGLSDDPNSDKYRYKYINTDYEHLRIENPDKFALLEEFKKQHLANQEAASEKNRLYLQFPRFVKNSAEILGQSTTVGVKETVEQYGSRISQFFQGSPDDYEEGVANYNPQYVENAAVEDSLADIPVGGLYDVDADDCSTNIQYTMWRYAIGCNKEAELREHSSFFKAIETTVKKNGIRSNKNDANILKSQGIIQRVISKNDKVREEATDNFLEKNYAGVTVKGVARKYPFLMRAAQWLMGRASFSFFGFNYHSALKNSAGIVWQSVIEGAARKHMDEVSLTKGAAWATKLMANMAVKGNYDDKNDKSLQRKIVEQFDFKQDNALKDFTDSMWRSVATDILDGKFATAPRKWLEDRATYQLGAGVLFFTKVNQNGKMISYMDALCEKDGKIRVKDGVDIRFDTISTEYIPQAGDTYESIARKFNIADPTGKGAEYVKLMCKGDISEKTGKIAAAKRKYDTEVFNATRYLTGEEQEKRIEEARKEYDNVVANNKIVLENTEYNKTRKEIFQTNNDIGGAYAEFDQPEWQRYWLYRMTFYLRRYFVPMFLKRFRIKEYGNVGYNDSTRGYYIQTLDAAWNILKSKGEYMKFMSTDEKQAMNRTIMEGVMLAAIYPICTLIFGYDDDDKDRFKKLRKKSGALEMPFVENDKGRKFDLSGYLSLSALHLILQIQQENEQFMPGLGGFSQIEQMTDLKSVCFGPTTDQLRMVIEDIGEMLKGDSEKGYYTRDMGPFVWQKKGSPKVYNHMLKFLAITGSEVDPAMAIQNLESQRAKVRR